MKPPRKPFKKVNLKGKWLLASDVILATAFTFGVIWLLSKILLNVSAFDPLELALEDTDLSDVYYSRIKMDNETANKKHPDIILVNISHARREAIAHALTVIGHEHPKVIGLDCDFRNLKQHAPDTDTLLKRAMGELPNLVTASSFNYSGNGSEKENDAEMVLGGSHPFFELEGKEGFSNFIVKDKGAKVRYYTPFVEHDGKVKESFSSKILELYDSQLFKRLQERKNLSEKINYDWRENNFITLQMSEINDSNVNLSILKNKIVLMGYLGDPLFPTSMEDEHLTPLNKNYLGHGLPDTYGSVIHANILAMTLSGEYIDTVPESVVWIVSILFCLLQMIFLIVVFVKKHIWYHIFGKLTQFFITILFIIIGIWLIHHRIKLDTTDLIIPIILSVDLLYFYEWLINYFNGLYGHPTYFAFHGHMEVTGKTKKHHENII